MTDTNAAASAENPLPAVEPTEDPILKKKKWYRTLAIFCLVLGAYGFVRARGDTSAGVIALYQQGYGEAASAQLVETLTMALGFWLLFFFIVPAKRMGRAYGGIAYLAIAGMFVVAGEAGHMAGGQDQKAALSDMKKAVTSAQNGETVDTTTHATGEAGAAEKFVKEMAARKSGLEHAYKEELLAADLRNLLTPARLNDDKDLRDSEAMIAKAKAAQKKYDAGMDQLFHDAADRINGNTVTDNEEFRKDMLQAMTRGEAGHKKDQDMEEKVIAEYGAMIDLLKTNRDGWTVKDGQLSLEDPKLSKAYQGHAETLGNLSEQINGSGAGQ